MPAWNPFLTLPPRRYVLAFSGALALWLGAFDLASAQASYDDANTPEGWAWSQIRRGDEADFNQHCLTKPPLDPKKKDDWRDSCRRLSSRYVEDWLTRAPWQLAVPRAGIRIKGARIVGGVNLKNAKLIRPIEIVDSRIEDGIILLRARTDSLISLDGSLINGAVAAHNLHAESDLSLGYGAVFKSDVSLNGAKIDGNVDMLGASFDGALNASSVQVGGSLYMQSDSWNKSSFKYVFLGGAKITGLIDMRGASFDGTLDANSLQAGDVDQKEASFKDFDLRGAKITGQMFMEGASFNGTLHADHVQVDGSLFMESIGQNKASFKDVDLTSAKITGQIDMDGASFDGTLNAESLQAESDLLMRDAHCAQDISMVFAHIGGNLDLSGATLAGLDLSGASVNADLRLGGPYNKEFAPWTENNGQPGALTMHNTHIGNLSDAEDAWPPQGQVHLDGFGFNHLGGFEGETKLKTRKGGMEWWDKNWARLDTKYSPTPYTQLAGVFTNMGDRDAANEIRYLSRVRERETQSGLAYVWSGALQYVAGFGIGTYTFRVLRWVLGFSLAAAVLLWWTVPEARTWDKGPFKGLLWCFGASLSRMLPVIEINREFTEFFNDPGRERLNWLQSILFSGLGIIGWLLGAILIAAVSGLTQSS